MPGGDVLVAADPILIGGGSMFVALIGLLGLIIRFVLRYATAPDEAIRIYAEQVSNLSGQLVAHTKEIHELHAANSRCERRVERLIRLMRDHGVDIPDEVLER